ncbi:MAG: TlpA family protein disulfide reductase [Pirellulales bacterium]|nr:TlpA family protein disulfide reductase [Pirellulales bacterium]
MRRSKLSFRLAIAALLSTTLAARAAEPTTNEAPIATILTVDHSTKIAQPLIAGDELYIPNDEVAAALGFEIKPEGACRAGLCIPLDRSPAAGFFRKVDNRDYFNVSKLATRLKQPVVVDREHGVWSFGPMPETSSTALDSVLAPDFALADREGKLVRLSDFRGKKVLLLTWASWCGCSQDLPGWQKLYEELAGKNFHIVAVAQDTGGEAAARKFYDKAKATFTSLVDPHHTVSGLYHMVNVPSGVWIDEQGRMVRPPEVAYSHTMQVLTVKLPGDEYVAALRDWIEKGADSKYALSPEEMRKRLTPPDEQLGLAEANFQLGVYLHEQGDDDAAKRYWGESQRLAPDNWNYHRQAWSFTPKEANRLWFQKVRNLNGRPYYAPLEFEHDFATSPK